MKAEKATNGKGNYLVPTALKHHASCDYCGKGTQPDTRVLVEIESTIYKRIKTGDTKTCYMLYSGEIEAVYCCRSCAVENGTLLQ